MKAHEIRKKFTEYFAKYGHEKISSSPLIPQNDPTLLFANAGMNQFKDFFTGQANPENRRAVTIQKCVRAGGKHNDLENVGFTARHHTFFEMMGNFSFGDYFKSDAIKFGWDFLTKELKLPKEKLYVTVHNSDQEAADIWHNQEGVPRDRIFYRDDKDNFWEMGEIGPCGPCSEIFFDHGEENSDKNADTSKCILDDEQRYVEIWNLVFMQYEKYKEGNEVKRRELPKPSVDTGAGLERVAAAVQGKYNNFDTDVFSGIIANIEKISGKKYSDQATSMRVVADHVRSSTMLITDGVIPSNEGRGYVLRRIIRRATRHLDILGVEQAGLCRLVDAVMESLGQEYEENARNISLAKKYLELEEENFRRTLKSGLKLLEKEIERLKSEGKKVLEGEEVFKLYDTHGFPVDLTELILQEHGLSLVQEDFDSQMQMQKERSKGASDFSAKSDNLKEFYEIKEKFGASEFLGYGTLNSKSKLVGKVNLEDRCALVFDSTPFYGESGGQAGDKGMINEIQVLDTQKPVEDLIVHFVKNGSSFEINKEYDLKVDQHKRNLTARNHTATHLLQAALIKVLGDHINQAGSSVSFDRLRFDFTHPEAVTKEQLKEVEKLVNVEIQKSIDVSVDNMSKDEAVNAGAMALFGEKYGDVVRVITVPGFSVELCGGTHVSNTNEIGFFSIVSEGSLSAGVRRIEALTSEGALERVAQRMSILESLESRLNVKAQDLPKRIDQIQNEVKESQKEVKSLNEKIQSIQSKSLFENPVSLKTGIAYKMVEVPAGSDLRKMGDLFIDKNPKGLVLLYTVDSDKASVLLKTFRGNKEFDCSKVLKEGFSKFEGRGGGKPDSAQGSVAVESVKSLVSFLDSRIME